MKRTYTKPLIAMESFQLNAAIAGACSTDDKIAINYGENTCGFDKEGAIDNQWAFFNYNNCDVDLTGPGGDGNDTECYHGPILTNVTFINS